MSESKLMRNARSLGRSTLCRNSTQDCCSMVSTRSWLGLVSISRPSVSGWLASALKYFTVWGLPSSMTSKSVFMRPGISRPWWSLTLKNTLTTLTCALKVCPDSSLSGCCDCWSWLCWGGTDEVGGSLSCTVDWAVSQSDEDNNSDAITTKVRMRVNDMVTLSRWKISLYCNTGPRNSFRRSARFRMRL